MATAPGTPAAIRPGRTIHLWELLRRRSPTAGRVARPGGGRCGPAAGDPLPVVKGLVAKVGGREIFVPVDQTGVFDGEELKLTSPQLDLRRFERRDGEVLLRADVLGHRLINMLRSPGPGADLELRQQWTPGGREEWVLAGVDVSRRPARLLRLLGGAAAIRTSLPSVTGPGSSR